LRKSGEVAIELKELYKDLSDITLFSTVQRALASNFYYQGDFPDAVESAKQGVVTYSDPKHALENAQLDVNEPSLSCLGYWALAL
jgi:hypothetical protein